MVLTQLQSLLEVHECVILPGIGGFVSQYKSAHVHPVKNTFHPPSRVIAFNGALNQSDGLLMHSIMKSESIDEAGANQLIKGFVNRIEQDIDKNGEANLVGVGKINRNTEGNFQFLADTEANFFVESYGLPHLYFKPIKQTTNQKATIRPMEKSETKAEEVQPSNKKKLFVVLPIVLLVLGGIGAFFFTQQQNHDVHEASLTIIEDSVTEGVVEDLHEEEIVHEEYHDDLIHEEEIVEEDFHNEEEIHHDEATHEVMESNDGRFHVIAGVFSSEENADVFKNNASNGKVLTIDGLYKVSVGQYASLREATNALSGMQSEYGDDVWVLSY